MTLTEAISKIGEIAKDAELLLEVIGKIATGLEERSQTQQAIAQHVGVVQTAMTELHGQIADTHAALVAEAQPPATPTAPAHD